MVTWDRNRWRTPADFIARVDNEFSLDFDAAADKDNHQWPDYWTKEQNALTQRPHCRRIWCNPPYNETNAPMSAWAQAFSKWQDQGSLVVALVPASTQTHWWHRFVLPAASEIRFIRGRLHFLKQGDDGDWRPETQPRHNNALLVFVPGVYGSPMVKTMEARL